MWQFGAVVHGRRSGADACSSVEARTVNGQRVIALIAVQGDLATPSLEGIKSAFAKLATVDEAALATLLKAVPPPPYAAGVAIALIAGTRAFVAAKGSAGCYRERGSVAAISGALVLEAGDSLIMASHASLGATFFGADVQSAPAIRDDEPFSNSGLDDALGTALAARTDFLAVAVARYAGG